MTRHDRAIQPAAEATGETVRSGGSTRRTLGAPRRGETVSGDEETLARGSTPARASSQWRGPRGAPRPRRVFSATGGKRQLCRRTNQNAGKRPNGSQVDLARFSEIGGAPRANSRLGVFQHHESLSHSWRSRSRRLARRPKRAPRGGGSRATRTMGVMVRPSTSRSTYARPSAPQPPADAPPVRPETMRPPTR
jgi:hypothetical protein